MLGVRRRGMVAKEIGRELDHELIFSSELALGEI